MNAPSDPGSTSRAQAHWALAVLTLVYAMNLIDRQIMGVLIEPVKKEFGASDTAMGFLTGLAFAAFYSALAIPFARYADRANRRNFVAWCCMGWSVMTGLCGMASLELARLAHVDQHGLLAVHHAHGLGGTHRAGTTAAAGQGPDQHAS